MTICPRVQGNRVDFSDFVSFVEDDSLNGIVKFEHWRSQHPVYKLNDGDAWGKTLLMNAVYFGNVTLVDYLVKRMDKNSLNLHSGDSGHHILVILFTNHLFVKKIDKLEKCAEILLEAGADVNSIDDKGFMPLDHLTAIGWLKEKALLLVPLAKLFLKAGAYCSGVFRYSLPVYLKAQEEIIDWPKTRNFFLGQKDPKSPLARLPIELLHSIIHAYYTLPDQSPAKQ